ELKAQEEKGQAMRATMQTGKLSREDFNDALREALRIYWTQGGLEGALARVDDEGQPLALCMGVTEAAVPVNSPVYGRGDLKNPGPEQPRGVPALFGLPAAPAVAAEASGRLMLAQWLTDPRHPLTARVMANRIWTHLFGAGLVRTVDDFGGTGEPPSHPELLDLLARRLIDGGWSVKALIRELVLARPYRQSSTFREAAFVKDPDNRLLWRMPPRRVDAEVLRDSMLAISGELDRTPRPGSLAAEVGTHSVAILGFQKDVPTDLDGSLHRSVYLPVFRENLPDVLALFDFAEPSLVVGQRDETNVPPQALYLMNSPFVTARAQALAERLLQQAPQREAQITQAFQLCFQRDPDAAERELARDFLATASGSPTAALAQFCQSLFAAPEFRITY
ncbi:MAG: DUF1553 domain-containing protein, partial [Verrucomicrobiales bacterium]|nr:DUF1553 domain-containing protein [Verrucomicrobiales bacterium]